MARLREPVCKQCRRENEKLFLKGERCLKDKCAMEKRPFPPGEHGKKPSKASAYSVQLREKQKAKRTYGVLEKQFRNYYDLAAKKKGITGENLLQLLELRLDNVCYRLGFAFSRAEARQMVRHKFFMVNSRVVNIPSCRLKARDVINLSTRGKKVLRITESVKASTKAEIPAWLEVNYDKVEAKIKDLPLREQIEAPIKEQLIVELYSK